MSIAIHSLRAFARMQNQTTPGRLWQFLWVAVMDAAGSVLAEHTRLVADNPHSKILIKGHAKSRSAQ